MNCDRTHFSRQIDYSGNLKFDGEQALRKQIVNFVRGIKRPRQNPVTEKQIVKWFRGTPSDYVRTQLSEVCAEGQVRQCMKIQHLHVARMCIQSIDEADAGSDGGNLHEATEFIDAARSRLGDKN